MGVFDLAKAAQKAMQARSKMSAIKAAGVSGFLSMLIDGLYKVTAVEIDREGLRQELGMPIEDKLLERVASVMEKRIKGAADDSRKALENELKQNTSLDDLKEMLQ